VSRISHPMILMLRIMMIMGWGMSMRTWWKRMRMMIGRKIG